MVIAVEPIAPVRVEQNFEGHFPVAEIVLRQRVTDEATFTFEGIGFAVQGAARSQSGADQVIVAEVTIDGEPAETVELPTGHARRRYAPFFRYGMPPGRHTVRVKLKNPSPDLAVTMERVIVYRFGARQAARLVRDAVFNGSENYPSSGRHTPVSGSACPIGPRLVSRCVPLAAHVKKESTSMRDFSFMWRVLAVVVALAMAPATAQAQSDGRFSGTVIDPSGAAVPAAAVLIRNERTGEERTVVTNAEGRYVVAGLQAVGLHDSRRHRQVRAARVHRHAARSRRRSSRST